MSRQPAFELIITMKGIANDAFKGEDGGGELGRILRAVARRVEAPGALISDYGNLSDMNGNTVGHWLLNAPGGDDD